MKDSSMSPKLQAPLTDLGLLLMRVMIGVVFIFHGSQKLFGAWGGSGMTDFADMLGIQGIPVPQVSAYLAAIAELGCGTALLLGLATRLVVIPLIITMLVASFVVHGGNFSLSAKPVPGMEYALTLGVVCLGLGLTGAGRLSLDHLLFRRKAPPAEKVA
jgi:putative oxidoreductase